MSGTQQGSLIKEHEGSTSTLFNETSPTISVLDGSFWKQLLDHYTKVLRLSSAVLTNEYSLIASSIYVPTESLDGSSIGTRPSIDELLGDQDMETFETAITTGDKIIYRGTFGFLRCWIPIVINSLTVGAVWLGCSINEPDEKRIERDCVEIGIDPKMIKAMLHGGYLMSEEEFITHADFIYHSMASIALGQFELMKTVKAEKQRVFISMIENSFEIGRVIGNRMGRVWDNRKLGDMVGIGGR